MDHLSIFVFTATAITFFVLGIMLEMMVATSVISRVIDRRQREIRHWQDEAKRLNDRRTDPSTGRSEPHPVDPDTG